MDSDDGDDMERFFEEAEAEEDDAEGVRRDGDEADGVEERWEVDDDGDVREGEEEDNGDVDDWDGRCDEQRVKELVTRMLEEREEEEEEDKGWRCESVAAPSKKLTIHERRGEALSKLKEARSKALGGQQTPPSTGNKSDGDEDEDDEGSSKDEPQKTSPKRRLRKLSQCESDGSYDEDGKGSLKDEPQKTPPKRRLRKLSSQPENASAGIDGVDENSTATEVTVSEATVEQTAETYGSERTDDAAAMEIAPKKRLRRLSQRELTPVEEGNSQRGKIASEPKKELTQRESRKARQRSGRRQPPIFTEEKIPK